jgi:hypothetical protein
MQPTEITLQSIQVERPDQHPDLATYRTARFRVLPADHHNSFVVPISVNLDQYGPDGIEDQARLIFHHLMKALAEATTAWDRTAHGAHLEDPSAASLTDARLGPAGDPAEGKRDAEP